VRATEAVANKEKAVDEISTQQISDGGLEKIPKGKFAIAMIKKVMRTPLGSRAVRHAGLLAELALTGQPRSITQILVRGLIVLDRLLES
jgi:hypothetical protein